MLIEYSMNYSSTSYSCMDDLVFNEINYNGSVIAISISKGCTYFNVPYGASKPKEEGIDIIIENAVNCEELVQLMGQTGLDELSQVRSIKYISNSIIDDMPLPIESVIDEPVAKPNYILVIISIAVVLYR